MDYRPEGYTETVRTVNNDKNKMIDGFNWNETVVLKSEVDDLVVLNVSADEFGRRLTDLYQKGIVRRHHLNSMSGEPQRINSDMCTSSALAVLIRRHQILHDELPTFSFADIRRNMTGENSLINPTKYHTDKMTLDIEALKKDGLSDADINLLQQQEQWMPHPIGPSYDMTWICSDGREYQTKQLKDAIVKSEKDLIKLIDSNPAGLYVYAKYNNVKKHAIVISDYEIDDNHQIIFYCFDSVENGESENAGLLGMRTKLGHSRLVTGNQDSLNSMFANIMKIVAMDSADQVMKNADPKL